MSSRSNQNSIDYNYPVKLADGVYWVGYHDPESGLHCNPYIIIDGNEAVLVDGGSRPDFPNVMMKILQTGIHPSSIKAMVFHHYDPDLCAGIPNFEDIIGREDLMIISDYQNKAFIKHYSVASRILSLEQMNHEYVFSSGRRLTFHNTPYAHSSGSFVTFDNVAKVLFSSDLFGSFGRDWDLYFEYHRECQTCSDYENCPRQKPSCPVVDMMKFHQSIMPSNRSLKMALEIMAEIPFEMIAPQHGSVIKGAEKIIFVFKTLCNLEKVGVDSLLGERAYQSIGNIKKLTERLEQNAPNS
ncbi:oxygen-binding di-iron domain-containing protein [Desulforegula conservatrix]|uniref:MBL fold metallo-hydrolase n=1 Tax=Desulforegula conservatrix TaxID=153026 RepID=UPI0003F8BABF|nr:MBL fold metallo-hydrolase [Desulforegula conservatrix]